MPSNSQNSNKGYSTANKTTKASSQNTTKGYSTANKTTKANSQNSGKGYSTSYRTPVSPEAKNRAALEEYYNSRVLAGKENPASVSNYGGGNRVPVVQSSAGGGGSSLGGSASAPVEAPTVDPLAALLAQLPQGPTGLENVTGAYSSLMGDYEKSKTAGSAALDASRAALTNMYSQNQADLQAQPNDYIDALLKLNTQNQNTSLGTVDQLKGIREAYMGDLGTSISARSAQAVNDITTEFNALKAQREQEVIDAFMEQQAAAASGGGGGGGRRFSGGSGSSGVKASETSNIYNPQNMAMLNELAQRDPAAAAELQRSWDMNFEETRGLRTDFDNASALAQQNATKGQNYSTRAKTQGTMSSVASKLLAAAAKNTANKNAKTAKTKYSALQTARQFGGVQTSPKTTLTAKS